ncbi:MAG TPA: hypothetical protein VFI42_07930 [Thermomicrobiaceae bacterium]|nr:hypothetical protein [Thermomicrobiaceae bacterium]
MEFEQPNWVVRGALGSLVAAALLLGVGFWARHAAVAPGQVPLLVSHSRGFWVLGLLAAVVGAALFQALAPLPAPRTAATGALSARPPATAPTAWVVPLIVSLTTVMLLGVYHSLAAIGVIVLGVFVVLLGSGLAQGALRTGDEESRQRARNVYTLLLHIIAFVGLSMIYINKLRSLFSATAVLVLVFLLLLQLTEGEEASGARRLVYALAGGVVLGEITWVLNYWRATGWTGGAALLIFFYLIAGLILNHLRGGVSSRDLAEYGGVSAIAFAVVAIAVLR